MTSQPGREAEEGVLDPWVTEWMAANPERATPLVDFPPELLEMARGPVGFPPTRDLATIVDDEVDGVPIRIYQGEGVPTGLVVYFHGGGYVLGSIGLMDNVARELAHGTGAVVVSVGYRLAPEDPYPAGLDDCERVTQWAFANAERFDVSPRAVAVAGESAGGNLAAAVALKRMDAGDESLAGQALIYPQLSGTATYPSAVEFDGLVISRAMGAKFWEAYSGGRDLDDEPYAVPLCATRLDGLPPALVVLGGCDMLRDEGRAYAARLRDAGVDVDEVCYAGQPHGFVNFDFPAASLAFDHIGAWLRTTLARSSDPAST
jgi:acetyl esterase